MASLNRIICFYGISSGSDPSRRFVQFVTPARGWAGFVTDYITPMINRGFRRFLRTNWLIVGMGALGSLLETYSRHRESSILPVREEPVNGDSTSVTRCAGIGASSYANGT